MSKIPWRDFLGNAIAYATISTVAMWTTYFINKRVNPGSAGSIGWIATLVTFSAVFISYIIAAIILYYTIGYMKKDM
jgi:hypothetical protein